MVTVPINEISSLSIVRRGIGLPNFHHLALELVDVELEPSNPDFKVIPDRRPLIPEPPPVRLVAVEDVRMPAPPGIEDKLDEFYVGLLEFERLAVESAGEMAYRAENFILRLEVSDQPIVRESLRPQGIEIRSLRTLENQLIELEIEYTRQRGLMPGQESILLIDPAGNWVEIMEIRVVH